MARMSEPQMVEARIASSTWPGPGLGIGQLADLGGGVAWQEHAAHEMDLQSV